MASELLPALFGAIGTLVGGGVTITANWIASRTQLRLATDADKRQSVKDYNDANAALLASAKILAERGHVLVERMRSANTPDETITSLHMACHEGWEDALRKHAAVLVNSPNPTVRDDADAVRDALQNLIESCNSAYYGGLGRTRTPNGFYDLLEHARDANKEFATHANKYSAVGELALISNQKSKSIREIGAHPRRGPDNRSAGASRIDGLLFRSRQNSVDDRQ
jgi:hypothetical protein